MIIEEHNNDIRIEFCKAQPDSTPEKPRTYTVPVAAIEIAESWIPEMMYLEKYPRLWLPEDPPPTDEIISDYILLLVNPEIQEEHIRIIFRQYQVAMTVMDSIRSNNEINFKKSHPELFL